MARCELEKFSLHFLKLTIHLISDVRSWSSSSHPFLLSRPFWPFAFAFPFPVLLRFRTSPLSSSFVRFEGFTRTNRPSGPSRRTTYRPSQKSVAIPRAPLRSARLRPTKTTRWPRRGYSRSRRCRLFDASVSSCLYASSKYRRASAMLCLKNMKEMKFRSLVGQQIECSQKWLEE